MDCPATGSDSGSGAATMLARIPEISEAVSGNVWNGTTGLLRPEHAASTTSPGSEPVKRSDSSCTGMPCR